MSIVTDFNKLSDGERDYLVGLLNKRSSVQFHAGNLAFAGREFVRTSLETEWNRLFVQNDLKPVSKKSRLASIAKKMGIRLPNDPIGDEIIWGST